MQGRAPFLVREYSLPNGPFVDLPLLLFPCPFHLRHLLLLSGKQRRFMLCIFPFLKKGNNAFHLYSSLLPLSTNCLLSFLFSLFLVSFVVVEKGRG